MAKTPEAGKCVHCLKDPVERNWDHVFPQAWYPDATPENLEKWQVPSCVPCNQRYGKIEGALLSRVGLALDPNNPASASIVQAALRSMKPDAGRDARDSALRAALAKKVMGEMLRGDQIPKEGMIPGMGDRWNQPTEEQVAVLISKESLRAMTEKFVRGLTYMEDKAFIERPYKIDFFVVDEDGAKECVSLLDKIGKVHAREPGIVIRRAVSAEDNRTALYEINFWQQFKTYASVSNENEAPPQDQAAQA